MKLKPLRCRFPPRKKRKNRRSILRWAKRSRSTTDRSLISAASLKKLIPNAVSSRLRSIFSDGIRRWNSNTGRLKKHNNLYGEENYRTDQVADSGRTGQPRATHRPRARSARRQHHGVLQGIQRGDQKRCRPGD